ncbi:bifunctional aspartate kinase/diaminopimelate decarboxylase [Elongatibacter sediminis]|uniref:aspartate kinase n=1 Tax=Elongatibacter sediminis TaxID=3119006 RepID=A0AAW9RIK8_9GAMM
MSEEHRPGWVVLKFGGTSVSSVERWETIRHQARENLERGHHVMIVVSALSGVTNLLTELVDSAEREERERILGEIEARHHDLLEACGLRDLAAFGAHWGELGELLSTTAFPARGDARAAILACGEQLSSAIGAAVLQSAGLDAQLQDARALLQAVPGSEANPLSVRCSPDADPDLAARLAAEGPLHITQGFIVAGPDGQTCLLGRGGSDTSAACLAARLGASALQIWTDVPGMFSADPRIVPEARLLREIDYLEAQELASMGAKVLHPPSIQPVARHGIPLFIRDTSRPQAQGTKIAATRRRGQAQVKGVVSRRGITLVHMQNPAMWRQVGFLADAFAVFKRHDFSVDLISTSESSVTVSLDPESAVDPGGQRLRDFVSELEKICRVEVRADCVSISLVGNAIRTNLGRLSSALDVFHDRQVHMVTQSANDLNLTLVVDPDYADSLVRKLHQLLIASQADQRTEFGPSWLDLNRADDGALLPEPWWRARSDSLLGLLGERDAAFVYHLETARAAARRLLGLRSVERVLYAAKANDHPEVLRALAAEGLGFECVSLAEVEHVLAEVPGVAPSDLLFTPNFASRDEYAKAFEIGATLTVDNSWVLHQWPELFTGREIFLRIDLESGHGHHRKVVTMGKDSKFGISLDHLESLAGHLSRHRIEVVGLHAHTGSGVIDPVVWQEQLDRLLAVLPHFPDVGILDLGGGFGVPERISQPGMDLDVLDRQFSETLGDRPLKLWVEPGRYLVAECGVLLARVTQLKDKGSHHYVGVATGMNSMIRPALYGAYHELFNLNRLDEAPDRTVRIVGPICESGDVLGESRLLPECREGDVILMANCGAYGRVMASHYNRRPPAEELILED